MQQTALAMHESSAFFKNIFLKNHETKQLVLLYAFCDNV